MYSPTPWKRIHRNKFFWKLMVVLNVALIAFLAFLFFRPSPTPSKVQVLNHSISAFREKDDYRLVIEEKTDDYSLHFSGTADDGVLHGTLTEKDSFQVEIKLENYEETKESLMIRQSEEQEWIEVAEAGVEELEKLVLFPDEIMEELRKIDVLPSQGPSKSLNGTLCKTFTWEIDDPRFYQSLFPGITSDNVGTCKIEAYLTQEESELAKLHIALLPLHAQEEATPALQRTIRINPDK